ncbi:PsbP-related protein [Flavobacterium sp. 3-210]
METLNIDLNKFVEISEKQINTYGKLIESKRNKIGQNEFHLFLYEAKMNGFELKFLQYDFVKNNKAYILTYTGKKDDFEKFKNQMEKIMQSFKLI